MLYLIHWELNNGHGIAAVYDNKDAAKACKTWLEDAPDNIATYTILEEPLRSAFDPTDPTNPDGV
jgi:hypothetical protein